MKKNSPRYFAWHPWGLLTFLMALLLLLAGCVTLAEVGTTVGQVTGNLTPEQAASINRSATAMDKAFESLTPEQEYYIGRAVAATILNKYKPLERQPANQYLNLLGQTLARASTRPETFGGYHFMLMDTDEINAFAAPGGLILISRGMIVKSCRSEDDLAAVLAHEIGHVEGRHGLKAIKKGRLTEALTILAVEGAKQFGGEDLAKLTTAFEGSINDVTSTLVNSGYSRDLEKEADASAVTILREVGYNPQALIGMLKEMKKFLKPGGADFAKTHPDPNDRIKDVQSKIDPKTALPTPQARQARFMDFLKNLS